MKVIMRMNISMNLRMKPIKAAQKVLLCCAVALFAGRGEAQKGPARLTLAQDGATAYTIALAEGAGPAEKNAAAQLQKYLGQITGAHFSIEPETNVAEDKPQILVGSGQRVRRISLQPLDKLGQDGILIETVGNKLILTGDSPRSVLYASYTFLEDVLGCRWWSSNEATIPRKATLSIGPQKIRYAPPLKIRETLYRDVFKSKEFQVQLKLNGHYNSLAEEWGGHLRFVPDLVHTFYKLLPPSAYFAAHPEWYSQIAGKRTATNSSQLCLTDPAMRAEMTRVLLEKLRREKNPRLVSLSQNDSFGGNCQCPRCKALDEREGSPGGSLLAFVNDVAADIEKEFPQVMVETLAYNYTRVPPKTVRPRANVIVRLVGGVGCTYDHPLDSKYSESFRTQVAQWSAITPRLLYWDYVANFSNYLVPHPNLQVLAPNIRFFAKNQAYGVYEQGDSGSLSGDFVRLRSWMLAHLLWNPKLDEHALRRVFMSGYYGPAGPYLARYLDLVSASFLARDIRLSSSGSQLAYMDLAEMNRATTLFDSAEKAVVHDPVLLKRVQRERLPLDHLWLLRYADLKRIAAMKSREFRGPADPAQATERFIQRVRDGEEGHGGMYSEGLRFAAYEPKLRQLVAASMQTQVAPPAEASQLAANDWSDIQDFRFNLPGASSVKDEQASDGNAAKPGGSWGIMIPLSGDLLEFWDGDWHCYISVRVEGNKSTGAAFGYGLYDYGTVTGSNISVQAEKIPDEKYHTYDLGVVKLNYNKVLWISKEGAGHVFVDRVFLVKVNKTKVSVNK